MRKITRFMSFLILITLLICGCSTTPDTGSLIARDDNAISIEESRQALNKIIRVPALDDFLAKTLEQTLAQVDAEQLHIDMISISLIDLSNPAQPLMGSCKGAEAWYPASVVKLAFMVYAMKLIQDGVIEYDDILQENMTEMIRPSSNVATQYVVDRVTNTTGGDELDPDDFEKFKRARYMPTYYYMALGLDGIYCTQKTWDELPGGRELQFLGEGTDYHFEFSNKMTTDDTARLLYLIDQRKIVSPEACEEMSELLEREPKPREPTTDENFFMRNIVPLDSRIWSKAGATGLEWHDASIIQTADFRRFILVIFTHFKDDTTPFIALYTQNVIEALE